MAGAHYCSKDLPDDRRNFPRYDFEPFSQRDVARYITELPELLEPTHDLIFEMESDIKYKQCSECGHWDWR